MCVKFNKAIIMIIIIFWWEFEFISYVWDIMWIDYFLIVLVWLAYVFVVELYMYVCMCSILKLWYFYFQIQWFSMILQTAKTIQQLLRWEYHPIRKTTDFIKSLQTKDFTTLNPLKRKKKWQIQCGSELLWYFHIDRLVNFEKQFIFIKKILIV